MPISAEDISREICAELAHFSNAPASFLHAWKQGVVLAGCRLFGDGTQEGLEHATSKWDLRPRVELIDESIDVMSSGQKVFLASLVSIYDSEAGGRLLKRIGVRGLADLGGLDSQRRAVIAALILNYTGW